MEMKTKQQRKLKSTIITCQGGMPATLTLQLNESDKDNVWNYRDFWFFKYWNFLYIKKKTISTQIGIA